MATKPSVVELRYSDVDEMRRLAGTLFKMHWDEIVGGDVTWTKLDPNWVSYYELEERGSLLALAAWIGRSLAAYSVGFVFQHQHDKNLTVYQNDVVFVDKRHRKSGLGMHIIDETVAAAKLDFQAQAVLFHVKPGSVLEKVLARHGFTAHEIQMIKVVT